MNRNDEVIEINLWKLIFVCLQKWWLIVLAALICGSAGYIYSRCFIAPTYQSTVKLYVNSNAINVGNISVSAADMNVSVKVVEIYEVILKTKDTLDVIIEKAGLQTKYDFRDLQDMISAASVNETQIFQVTVTNTSPQDAHLIATTIAEELPDIIAEIINGTDAKIVEHSIIPEQKIGPSNSRNAMIGALIGFVVVVAVLVIMELADTTIKDEEDLTEVLEGVPILAYIPDLSGNKKRMSRYARNYYRQQSYEAYSHKNQNEGGDEA